MQILGEAAGGRQNTGSPTMRTLAAIAIAMAAAGCSVPASEALSIAESPIVGGHPDLSHDGVVFVVAGGGSLGSGVLGAPNILFTTKHSLENPVTAPVQPIAFVCQENGYPRESEEGGGFISQLADPATIEVYTGQEPKVFVDPPAARGVRIITVGGDLALCSFDLAAVILDRDVVGVTPAMVWQHPVKPNDLVDVVGYGHTLALEEPGAPVRRVREAVPVKLVTALTIPVGATNDLVSFPPRVLATGEAGCSRDSGGAAFRSGTTDLVGVLSAIANVPEDGSCQGPDIRTVFLHLAAVPSFLEEVYAAAGQELVPSCDTDEHCPEGTCQDRRCVPDESSGCAVRPGTGPAFFCSLLFALILARRRRIRS